MNLPGKSVRVVCVVYNPGAELARFIETLESATAARVELVLVSNGETTPALDAAAAAGIDVIRAPRNLGYGQAANLGARDMTEGWLVVANPDIIWSPGALDALITAADEESQVGSAGPRILNDDGSTYPSARAVPSLATGSGHALLGRIWPGNPFTRAYRQDRSMPRGNTAVGWLSGACLLLRPAAFEQVRGFDSRYFMFFEDLDLGERLGKSGWVNLYVPGAVVTHTQGVSWKHDPVPMIRAHHASARAYFAQRYNCWYRAPLGWMLRCGLRLREAVAVRAAQGRTRASA
jgi:N-acetylglucosaminyl-diphospho-decaprenol L-rhamnosyltransferase